MFVQYIGKKWLDYEKRNIEQQNRNECFHRECVREMGEEEY